MGNFAENLNLGNRVRPPCQLVFKLSFSYFDKLFCGILLDFVCLYFSLFIIVTLAYYVDSFHLQKFMHFCVVYHLLWSYYLYYFVCDRLNQFQSAWSNLWNFF